MADSFDDPIDEIEVWDGKRLRVMIVWDLETKQLSLRMCSEQSIPSLGMMERAKMMLAATYAKERESAGLPKMVRFDGPIGPQ